MHFRTIDVVEQPRRIISLVWDLFRFDFDLEQMSYVDDFSGDFKSDRTGATLLNWISSINTYKSNGAFCGCYCWNSWKIFSSRFALRIAVMDTTLCERDGVMHHLSRLYHVTSWNKDLPGTVHLPRVLFSWASTPISLFSSAYLWRILYPSLLVMLLP